MSGQLVLGDYLPQRGIQIQSVIRGAIAIEGIFDLPLIVKNFPTYQAMFVTFAFGDDTTLWHDASPQNLSGCARVPWLLVHSPEVLAVKPRHRVPVHVTHLLS
jgi:hypothetical protein